MRSIALILLLAAVPALAEPDVAGVLRANRAASGGDGWNGKSTLQIDYAYSGQGLTGTTTSLQDLPRGAYVDSYTIGPNSGASGYDGNAAWEKEPSGTVAPQAGGDTVQLAINEAYRNSNRWWQDDRGGAAIRTLARKSEGGHDYDVLDVTPRGGKTFQAWFDAGTHVLARVDEVQVTQTITTFFSDYADEGGARIAHTLVVDDGSGEAGRQTYKVTSARFSPARDISVFAAPKTQLDDYAIDGGAAETSVPFRLVNNHIYADVSINGAKPLNFIFDTGGHNLLTPDSARRLAVKSQGSQTSAGGGEEVAQSGVAHVDSIRVGAAVLKNQPVSVLQFSNAAEGVEEDGMIGYEFFARFVTRFDYAAKRIVFIDKRRFDPKDAGTPVPFRFYHQFPEVLGRYDGIDGRFGIDTGARTALMLTRPFAEKNDLRARAPNGVEALTGWGVGGPSRGYVFRGGDLTLGDVSIRAPLTQYSTDKGGAGGAEAFPNNVGGGVLKRFVVTFDYDHATMYLKPIAGAIADLDRFDRSGIWLNLDGDAFKIVDVAKGTPAAAAGLKVGDRITRVDGKAVKSMSLPDLRERLRNDAAGTHVAFEVIRDGKPVKIEIVLRDLI